MSIINSKLCNSKDPKEVNEMFEENYKLAFKVLHEEFPSYSQDEEAQQYAFIGLWSACLAFDDTKGVPFSSFAWPCIKYNVLRYFNEQNHEKKKRLEFIDNGENVKLEDRQDYNNTKCFLYKPLNELLTPKQIDILRLTYEGKSCRDVAKQLGSNRTTISQQRRAIGEIIKDNIVFI